jgi:hypothetical protein
MPRRSSGVNIHPRGCAQDDQRNRLAHGRVSEARVTRATAKYRSALVEPRGALDGLGRRTDCAASRCWVRGRMARALRASTSTLAHGSSRSSGWDRSQQNGRRSAWLNASRAVYGLMSGSSSGEFRSRSRHVLIVEIVTRSEQHRLRSITGTRPLSTKGAGGSANFFRKCNFSPRGTPTSVFCRGVFCAEPYRRERVA